MQRKEGFYWVRRSAAAEWEIAFWAGSEWQFVNSEIMRGDPPFIAGEMLTPPEGLGNNCPRCGEYVDGDADGCRDPNCPCN